MPDRDPRPAPEGFLWGVAISGHQSEGANVNFDSWLCETVTPSVHREPSRDACDSYDRFVGDTRRIAYVDPKPSARHPGDIARSGRF